MTDQVAAFIDRLPKAELHLHLEGTLEPELKFELAARNDIALPYASAAQLRAGYAFGDLTSFLGAYYEGMSVLRGEQDFYDLAMAYFRTASAQHIMCFLRDMSAESALATLEQSLPHRDKIIGVGLDSDERDHPPVKFREVFARARAEGYRLTMHCDVDQADSVAHIWQCLDDIGVERIDHGVNCLEDDALVARLARDGIGLTVCPVSNLWVTDGLKAGELKTMLDRSLRATVNSDDPAYFGAYVNQNLVAAQQAAALTVAELAQLARNSFQIAWLTPADRAPYLADLDTYLRQAAP